jgi:hypothetical protein
MRDVKKANIELVYSAMKAHYERNKEWRKPLSFKDIEESLSKRNVQMNRRCIYRYLETLMKEKPPRVIKKGRGSYSIDFAVRQIDKEREAFTHTILYVDSHRKFRATATERINGRKMNISKNPIFRAPETKEIFKQVKKWRLQIHNQKDIARAEANAWTNSFIDVLKYNIETGEAPLKIRPESLITTDKRVGIDPLIFRKAMEIMFELLGSLDWESMRADKAAYSLGDAQLSVKITFNPVSFTQALKYYRDHAEIPLNVHKHGKQFELNEKLEKRVFEDVFSDQPNSLVTEDTPIRFRCPERDEALPSFIYDILEAFGKNEEDEN